MMSCRRRSEKSDGTSTRRQIGNSKPESSILSRRISPADLPIFHLRKGKVSIGKRTFKGDDLSAYFIQPRKDSDVASVIAVAASGAVGMRSTSSVSFFVPFTRYPDCAVMRTSIDNGQGSVLAAGYFGLYWSMEDAEFAFAD